MANRSRAKSEEKTKEVYKPSRATRLFTVWRKLKKSKMAVAGFGIVVFMVSIAIFAPLLAPYHPETGYGSNIPGARSRRPPSMEHILGTDASGRDMLSMIFYGARVSLYVGLAAVSLEILVGITIGMSAGYFGGVIDELLMRITDMILTLPELPLLIVAVTVFEVRSIHVIVLVMGFLGWPYIARYVRGEFLSLREATYVEAAKSMGATSRRIITRHILPNIVSLVIVLATMDIPWYIFYEATLTFLGFGDPSSASWGVLLEKGYLFYTTSWWMITFPGLVLFFTSLGFNLFGDGLRDALDVTERGR